jgi:TPR repeat protein
MAGATRALICGLLAAAAAGAERPAAAQEPTPGSFYGVVAGVSDYAGRLSPVPGLRNAVPRMAEALRSYAQGIGYPPERIRIIQLSDGSKKRPTNEEIVNAVWIQARETVDRYDMLVVFFTGHGETSRGRMILYASGADGASPTRKIDLYEDIVTTIGERSRAGTNLVFIDACQTPRPGQSLDGHRPMLGDGVLKNYAPPPGVAVFYAANEGEVAWVDMRVGYGYFTKHLASLLEDSEPPQWADALLAQLQARVKADMIEREGPSRFQNPTWSVLRATGRYAMAPGTPAVDQRAATSTPTSARAVAAQSAQTLGARGEEGYELASLKTAAERGDIAAQVRLAGILLDGKAMAKNDVEAAKWFEAAAKRGDAVAQANLGWLYEVGRGVARDATEAVKWYRLAAEKDNPYAQNNLGAMYSRGIVHGGRNDAEAVKWYRLAAQAGHARAQNNLGTMYRDGRGVPRNEPRRSSGTG